MAPICVRTSFCISLKSSSEGTADVGCSAVERVTKAKGRWPFSASGMPTTQHSAMVGWDDIACSMEPVRFQLACVYNKGEWTDLPVLNRCAATLIISSDLLMTWM